MYDQALIQKLEELSMNALPAHQTQLYDGWVLRFSNGYTKRANSIHPIYFSNENVKRKIRTSEQLYRDKNINIVYKMTPHAFPQDLDRTLDENGYLMNGMTSVQTIPLNKIDRSTGHNVIIYNALHKEWFSTFCTLNNVSDNDQPSLKRILSSVPSTACFMMLTDDNNQTMACGRGVLEGDYIGVFDIVTSEKYRNQGYGEALVRNMMQWGRRNGAIYAYLQVILRNTPAMNLYAKLGFEERYRYWYRMKA